MIIQAVFIILLHTLVRAEIMEYGLWTGHDWTNTTENIKVVNGIASGHGARRGVQIEDATLDHPVDSTYLL